MPKEKEGTKGQEKPVLESLPPESLEVSAEDKAKELLAQLNNLNLDSPEKIQNTFQASQQAGQIARLLGTEREKSRQLEERLANLESQRQLNYGQEDYATEGVNLKNMMQNVMRSEIGNFVNAQRQASEASMKEYAQLQTDPDYSLIQPVWEKHIANPNVQLNIQGGNTTLTNEFNKVKIAFYKGIAMNSRDTLQGLINKTGIGAIPPHIEAGDTDTYQLPESDTTRESLEKIRQQSTGTMDDLDAMIKTMLPDTDSFFVTAKTKKGR